MKPQFSIMGNLIRGVGILLILCVISGFGCGGKNKQIQTVEVTINTAPESGAFLLMDGFDRGATPVDIPNVRPDTYEIILRQDRYKRKITEITVTEEAVQAFTIQMEPLEGTVSINSVPSDAEVYLDGSLIGTTPILRKVLQVGAYSYELRHPDYFPETNDFRMEENFNLNYNHDLRPVEARLTIHSRPSSAQIWLNNILQRRNTPLELALAPGNYLVSTYIDGFIQADKMVILKPNEDQKVLLEMSPGKVPQGMVLIPAGTFTMGSTQHASDERPTREVYVDAFYMDRFEVTNQEYQKFSSRHKFPEGQENYPAWGISWNDAGRYCASVGKRLPTEAEWEKAARGTDERMYPWGDIYGAQLANTEECGFGLPVAVGHFYATQSFYGCMDLAGNAYEWVSDWYDAYPGNESITKDYGQIFRILRGGSYMTKKFEARTTARHFDRMDADRKDYGCRCAMDARE
ncbi:MAG: SUMF1/EgtB/PvdO family nonheme iron enzyme [Candidatus Hydrogenedentales bacterium]|jgi:sulfatase modifying factor 1